MSTAREYTGLEVAIIGMSGKFPGAENIAQYWENLDTAREGITHYNADQLAAQGIKDLPEGSNFVGSVGKLDKPEWFDSDFFGFSHTEAEVMDPQVRVMLECAWEAFEDAGYNPKAYDGYVGVFAGASPNETWEAKTLLSGKEQQLGAFETELLKNKDFISAHIAYRLNLKGPALSAFTACSTSLTTIHMACQSLLNGECDMALAGGVSINLVENYGYLHQEGMILSADGHCKPFDATATGTISSDGAGVLLLKPLDAALRDGDHIYAAILGTAINNDGNQKIGFTAPGLSSQVELMTAAQQLADVSPESITYIETHGTGTSLGDPIEFEALRQAYPGAHTNHCALGAVKANIGHLDTAAGVAAVIKTALALKNQRIPAHPHYEQPNAACDFDSSPFYINSDTIPWDVTNDFPRRAAVNSLGIGGSNAHIIMEEVLPQAAGHQSEAPVHLLLSARSDTALRQQIKNHLDYLQQAPADLQAVAATLVQGREHHRWRCAIHAQNQEEALQQWEQQLAHFHPQPILDRPELTFLFSGQGSQYPGMFATLFDQHPQIWAFAERCLSFLKPETAQTIRKVFRPGEPEVEAILKKTQYAQVALFIGEYSLAQHLIQEGLKPAALLGHSVGEYVAATIAEAIDLADALQLIEYRAALMQQMQAGSMLSVNLSVQELQPYLQEGVDLAVINTGDLCVLAGDTLKIDQLNEVLSKKRVLTRKLHTSHAFHSHHMEPMLGEFKKYCASIHYREPQIPYLSNYTGTWITLHDLQDPDYWSKHLRHTVQFSDNLHTLLSTGTRVFLELGPGNSLCQLTKRHHSFATQHRALPLLQTARMEGEDSTYFWQQIGHVWETGIAIDTLIPNKEEQRHVPLPTYPFERQRYWIDGQLHDWFAQANSKNLSAKAPLQDWFYQCQWNKVPRTRSTTVPPQRILCITNASMVRGLKDMFSGKASLKIVTTGGHLHLDAAEPVIIAAERAHHKQLMQALKAEDWQPELIVYIPQAADRSMPDWAVQSKAITEPFYWLADAWSQVFSNQAVQVVAITQGGQAPQGHEALQPAMHMLTGTLAVLAQEYTELNIRNLDIAADALPDTHTLLSCLAPQFDNGQLALRGGTLWQKTYTPLALEAQDMPAIIKGGTYLITGGLGHLGRFFAGYLAEAGAATIHLVARNPQPGVEAGKDIKTWQQQGVEIHIHQADVADPAQVKACIAQTGALDGVIHAAANMRSPLAMINTLDRPQIEEIMAAKIAGTEALAAALEDQSPAFVLCMSSLSVMLGGLGYAAYAASNAYMDALAHNMATRGKSWITAHWDGWDREANTPDSSLNISQEEGKNAFATILAMQAGQVCISTTDLNQRNTQWQEAGAESVTETTDKQTVKRYARPNLETDYREAETALQTAILTIWEDFFQIAPLGVDDDFFALGGDSLKGTALVNRYKDLLGEMVYVSVIFEASTPASLATFFEQHYPEAAAKINGTTYQKQEHKADLSLDHVRTLAAQIPAVPAQEQEGKNPRAVFILSSSRSGSTLLRVMLGAHSKLIAPQELELLNHSVLQGDPSNYQGLIRTYMQLQGKTVEEATHTVQQHIDQKTATKLIYRELQHLSANSLLVDKNPSYALNLSVLQRIEAEFEEPLYIHLCRHPYGMIQSKTSTKLDLLTGELQALFNSGQELGEFEWLLANSNIETFLADIPVHRKQRVKYEDLLSAAPATMQSLAALMELDFEQAMLDPYADSKALMTDGIHQQGMMIGDPKFHQHKGISSQNAWKWREEITHDFLSEDTLNMAASYGYQSIAEMDQAIEQQYQNAGLYPVSAQQRKLLLYADIFQGTTNYNIPRAVRVPLPDKDRLQAAVKELTQRHAGLRTSFEQEGDQYMQRIHPAVEVPVHWVTLPEGESLSSYLRSLVAPFELSISPLFKITVIQESTTDCIIHFDTHHIITDAIAQNILILELIKLYHEISLPPVQAQYHDYAVYQHSYGYKKKLKEQEAYWLEQYNTLPPALKLPTDHSRPAELSFEGAALAIHFDAEEKERFNNCCRDLDQSRYMLAMTIYQVFLHQLTAQKDIAIGTVITRRPEQRFEETIGMFVNTLPLRASLSQEQSIKGLSLEVRRQVIDLFDHADYSFDELVARLDITRDKSRNPLFDTAFVYQNFETASTEGEGGITLDFVDFNDRISRYDLSCVVFDQPDSFKVQLEYNKALFNPETIQSFADYFKILWASIVVQEHETISQLPAYVSKNMQDFIEQSAEEDINIEFNF